MSGNALLVVGVLFGISEALSMIPVLKANGIFQLLYNVLKTLDGK